MKYCAKESGDIQMKSAYCNKHADGSITCTLCPHSCKLDIDEKGICGVRRNNNGELESTAYGLVSALHEDPIEKKPLYHFYPGSTILSMGSFGCNFKCNFCQNHSISQVDINSRLYDEKRYSPADIIQKALSINNNIGLAFTYNEPIVWIEYMLDIAYKVKQENLKTAVISNGFVNPGPLNDLIPYIDAYNIDLKAFDNVFYVKETGGKLKPVLKTLEKIASSGKHLEVTMLIIPTLNDNEDKFRELVSWLSENCGTDIVLHLSKYFPNYMSSKPITPDNTLLNLYKIAREKIHYTYLGNTSISTGRDTICPNCSHTVIKRNGYNTDLRGLDSEGNCKECKTLITSYFSSW